MSEYLILIYDGNSWEAADTAQTDWVSKGHGEFMAKYGEQIRGGNALQYASTATTVTPDGSADFAVTDGPYAETKEALGGYYLVEAADLDAAIEMAKAIPLVGGSVEIRPVLVLS